MSKRITLASSTRMALQPAPASKAAGGAVLREHAYAELKRRILGCEFRPGEAINEAQIGALLGLGRTPVHQALHRVGVVPVRGLGAADLDGQPGGQHVLRHAVVQLTGDPRLPPGLDTLMILVGETMSMGQLANMVLLDGTQSPVVGIPAHSVERDP